MLKKAAFCAISLLIGIGNTPIHAMVKPTPKPASYYNEKNLQELYAQGIQRHAPMAIFIDQDQIEKPENPQSLALTRTLAYAINSNAFPILTSSSILYNLLARITNEDDAKHPENKRLKIIKIELSHTLWNLYLVPDSSFLLLIPKRFIEVFPDMGLKFNNLDTMSNLLLGAIDFTGKGKDYEPLLDTLTDIQEIKSKQTAVESDALLDDFKRIFITKNEFSPEKLPIWDLFIVGHGSTEILKGVSARIADMTPYQINALFNFSGTSLPLRFSF